MGSCGSGGVAWCSRSCGSRSQKKSNDRSGASAVVQGSSHCKPEWRMGPGTGRVGGVEEGGHL